MEILYRKSGGRYFIYNICVGYNNIIVPTVNITTGDRTASRSLLNEFGMQRMTSVFFFICRFRGAVNFIYRREVQ